MGILEEAVPAVVAEGNHLQVPVAEDSPVAADPVDRPAHRQEEALAAFAFAAAEAGIVPGHPAAEDMVVAGVVVVAEALVESSLVEEGEVVAAAAVAAEVGRLVVDILEEAVLSRPELRHSARHLRASAAVAVHRDLGRVEDLDLAEVAYCYCIDQRTDLDSMDIVVGHAVAGEGRLEVVGLRWAVSAEQVGRFHLSEEARCRYSVDQRRLEEASAVAVAALRRWARE